MDPKKKKAKIARARAGVAAIAQPRVLSCESR
ncbi:MAG: hypothetical protein BWY44_00918 [Candidatus Omnitrophica bacterium ADurb.Bin292]|nr:MAG: hypothetical protein BWY44_00918 [Candidatus Omnitrophica bacterium ADurb.Bin292]